MQFKMSFGHKHLQVIYKISGAIYVDGLVFVRGIVTTRKMHTSVFCTMPEGFTQTIFLKQPFSIYRSLSRTYGRARM